MRRWIRSLPVLCSAAGELLAAVPVAALAGPAPVAARVETTLETAGGQLRQLALDGNEATFFESAREAGDGDHFTLVLDAPVNVMTISVTTGGRDDGGRLDAGALDVSTDGKKFIELARFSGGTVLARMDGWPIRAVRIRPAAQKHSLAVREIRIDSTPAVEVFEHPFEISVDVTAAPEMKEWAEKTAGICERAFPMICRELWSDGFQPRPSVTMTLKPDYNGVAATGGGRITGSSKFFKEHPDDVGAMVHETVHVVQAYRGRGNPSWLVEGVADYVRFFKFEPGKLRPPSPERARYNGSYKVTAQFLAYITEKYDREIVRKLNRLMREGQYKEEVFKELTGKTVQELGEEWKASLARP